jgi:hypothetical protein
MMRRRLAVGLVAMLVAAVAGCGAPASAPAGGAVQVGSKSAPPERSTAYQILSRERADGDGRKRLRAKLTLQGGLDTDRSIEAIRGAIQELLPADGEVDAVEVLAYRNEGEANGPWTIGHGFATKDGKGWKGDGRFEGGLSDRNNIELDLKLPSGDDHFSLAR